MFARGVGIWLANLAGNWRMLDEWRCPIDDGAGAVIDIGSK
jgi:hypothetical protein